MLLGHPGAGRHPAHGRGSLGSTVYPRNPCVCVLNKARQAGSFPKTKLSKAPGRETAFTLAVSHIFLFISRPGSTGLRHKGQVRLGGTFPNRPQRGGQGQHQPSWPSASLIFWNQSFPWLWQETSLFSPLLLLCSFVSIQE